jgi:hypothetical protein
MKTLVIKVDDAAASAKEYPVSLYLDDGNPGWLDPARALANGTIPKDLKIKNAPHDPVEGKPLKGSELRAIFLAQSDSSERFQAIGEYLYELLFQGQVRTEWERLRTDYPRERPDESEGRRTVLDIAPKKLRMLPWELMNFNSLPLFVDTLNPFVRGSLNSKNGGRSYMWPLHVLIVVGSKAVPPGEIDEIRAEEEVSTIEDALIKFGRPVEWEVLRRPTNQKLRNTLQSFEPHIFHFIGHGRQALASKSPVLEFEGNEIEKTPPWEWTASKIGIDLNQVWVPRLAFINACRSSSEEESEKVWGITEAFIGVGVPAVIGMQADIQGDAAASFPGRLYEALARDKFLDEALAEARSDVMDLSPDGLERRDWALATFFLSVLPHQVLPMLPAVTNEFKMGIEAQFSHISDFVDRVAPRRTLWYGVEPISKRTSGKNLLMVKGAKFAGKTWLVYWCLKICAWRERNIMYVSLLSKDQDTKDFLEVLRLIKKACISGQPIGRAVDPAAFYDFNKVVNYALNPSEPHPDSIPKGTVVEDKGLSAKKSIDDDSIKFIIAAFKGALQRAANNAPLVIALDDLMIREDHFRDYLIPSLIKPIAVGQEESLKKIRMILVASTDEYENKFQLGDLENVSVTVRLDLLSKEEQSYFSRELCVLKGLSRQKMSEFFTWVENGTAPALPPDTIRQALKLFQQINPVN